MVAAAVALCIGGCSESAAKARTAMIQKCTDDGLSQKLCTCAMDKLAKKYDMEDALAYEERKKTPDDTYRPDHTKALLSCASDK